MMFPPIGFLGSAANMAAPSTCATTWLVITTATPNCEGRAANQKEFIYHNLGKGKRKKKKKGVSRNPLVPNGQVRAYLICEAKEHPQKPGQMHLPGCQLAPA